MQRKTVALDQNAILVTGGSGFIGRQLVQKLAALETTVVSMYRHHLPEPSAFVYPVCSDMSSAELIAAPLRGVQTVVHLAWSPGLSGLLPKKRSKNPEESQTENLKALRNLIKAMEKNGTKRLIFMSALGARRGVENPFLQEKYLAEFAVLNSSIPEKIILRPSLVYSGDAKNDRLISTVAHLFDFPAVCPIPEARLAMSPLYLENLISLLIAFSSRELPVPTAILELDGGHSIKTEEFFKLVGRYTGKKKKIILRGPLAKTVLPFFERYGAVSKDQGTPNIPLRTMLELSRPLSEKTFENDQFAEFWPETLDSVEKVFGLK